MAELEIHHEHEGSDPGGRAVGVLASILAVLLAVVTILSHRAHTDAVLVKSGANDAWSYYQSKRIKYHSLELGQDILTALGAKGPEAERVTARYEEEKKRYAADSEKAQEAAKGKDEEAERVESRALRYDFGEGLLEIGLVLTSLYFISRSRLFPVIGILAAILGTVIATSGLLMK